MTFLWALDQTYAKFRRIFFFLFPFLFTELVQLRHSCLIWCERPSWGYFTAPLWGSGLVSDSSTTKGGLSFSKASKTFVSFKPNTYSFAGFSQTHICIFLSLMGFFSPLRALASSVLLSLFNAFMVDSWTQMFTKHLHFGFFFSKDIVWDKCTVVFAHIALQNEGMIGMLLLEKNDILLPSESVLVVWCRPVIYCDFSED